MEWLQLIGYGVVAMVLTGVIANKLGWGKFKGLLRKTIGVVRYAREKLVMADDLLIKIHRAAQDDNISAEELKALIKVGGEFAQDLRDTSKITDALHELDGNKKLPL